jgi:hypothetical protein
MKVSKRLGVIFLGMLLMLNLAVVVSAADLQRIDRTNWESVKGLLPESALKWVKSGDMVLKYGSLDYDPNQVLPTWVMESKKENIGKYKLTAKKAIVEVSTGKTPKFIKGIPFPDIKASDPDAGEKVMWNTFYMRDANGPLKTKIDFKFMGRKTGYERSIFVDWYSKPFDGYQDAENWPNKDNFESVNQVLVTSPFDMAGTAQMTWRYRVEKEDMLNGYVPAIRRVRRLTPAGRSDAMFGSDFARDDGGYGIYDGAISSFKWKIVGEGEVLGGFIGAKPMGVNRNKDGEWEFDLKNKDLVQWSFSKKGGSAAPWFVDSAVWTKRPVWIIEGIPKDPYYNYGKQIMYIDKELNLGHWKVIYDRTGKYWKTAWTNWGMAQDTQKSVNWNAVLVFILVDERSQHATAVDSSPKYINAAKIDSNQFSLAGFTTLCK